jgi:hypothetical protein
VYLSHRAWSRYNYGYESEVPIDFGCLWQQADASIVDDGIEKAAPSAPAIAHVPVPTPPVPSITIAFVPPSMLADATFSSSSPPIVADGVGGSAPQPPGGILVDGPVAPL